MSVASTKAFYAQVAAGFLLALRHRRGGRRRRPTGGARAARRRCASCPTRWRAVLDRRADDRRGRPAARARRARYWAVVGNGPNRIAAEEVRIKLSRALLQVDRLRRHRGQEAHRPVVRAADPRVRRRARRARTPTTWPRRWRSTGPTRRRRSSSPPRARSASRAALQVHHRARRSTRRWRSCSSAMVGHLFGYEAALAIDAQARPLREARAAIEEAVGSRRAVDGDDLLAEPAAGARAARPPASSTACAAAPTTATSRPAPRCGWRRCSATPPASLPLEAYQVEYGKVGTPSVRGRRPHRRAHPRPSRS